MLMFIVKKKKGPARLVDFKFQFSVLHVDIMSTYHIWSHSMSILLEQHITWSIGGETYVDVIQCSSHITEYM